MSIFFGGGQKNQNVEATIIMFPPMLNCHLDKPFSGETSPSPCPRCEPVSAADPDTNPPPGSDATAGANTRPAMTREE